MVKLDIKQEILSSIVSDYLSGLNFQQLHEKYKLSTWKINEILLENNVTKRTNKELRKKFECNSDYFKIIDTKDKAYFLGLLYADGWNDSKTFNVGIQLKSTDVKIIELLKQHLNYTGNITNIIRNKINQNHSDLKRLVVKDEILSQHLINHGCVPNKSLKLNSVPNLSPSLIHHFIRGYFDGDGSVHNDTSTNSLRIQIVGNESFLLELQRLIVINCHLKTNKLYKAGISDHTKSLVFSGNIVCKKVYDYLYNDCDQLYIDRKFLKFKEKWDSL